ncbi:hypothetical protein CC2G_003869 [Coprinopsis cinerea AmutBmut pab1-1]|nr:hypothetical protein CC2G_003869 [Coprinopsis cinerea AmutBmut pab1-1]
MHKHAEHRVKPGQTNYTVLMLRFSTMHTTSKPASNPFSPFEPFNNPSCRTRPLPPSSPRYLRFANGCEATYQEAIDHQKHRYHAPKRARRGHGIKEETPFESSYWLVLGVPDSQNRRITSFV